MLRELLQDRRRHVLPSQGLLCTRHVQHHKSLLLLEQRLPLQGRFLLLAESGMPSGQWLLQQHEGLLLLEQCLPLQGRFLLLAEPGMQPDQWRLLCEPDRRPQ
jgi:hypothetical protein